MAVFMSAVSLLSAVVAAAGYIAQFRNEAEVAEVEQLITEMSHIRDIFFCDCKIRDPEIK